MARKSGIPKKTPDLSKAKATNTLGKVDKQIPMTKSGFCEYGPGPAHVFCVNPNCTCACHDAAGS